MPTPLLNFSSALVELRNGNKVTRKAWEEVNTYLVLQENNILILARMMNAEGTVTESLIPWNTDSEDLLAEDWTVVAVNV